MKQRDRMKQLGFDIASTGGNCTAYARQGSDGATWYIADELQIPTRREQRCTVEIQNTNGESMGYLECVFGLILDGKVRLMIDEPL